MCPKEAQVQAPTETSESTISASKTVPRTTPAFTSAGAKRIFIELSEHPTEAKQYAKKWEDLVSDIAPVVKSNIQGKTGQAREEAFFTEVWGVLNSNLNIKFGVNTMNFLSESLETKIYRCGSSAFLVYDVAKECGVNMNLVIAPEHVLVVTDHFLFQTTNGEYFPKDELGKMYLWHTILKESQITAVAYDSKAGSYYREGKFIEAFNTYTKEISIVPDVWSAYYNRGNTLGELGKFKEAIADYTITLKAVPSHVSAHNNRGNSYFVIGQSELAKADYTFATKVKPASTLTGFAHNGLGNVYMQQKKYKEAIDNYNMARKLAPAEFGSYLSLGNAYRETKEYAKAIEIYEEGVKHNPASADSAYNNIGITCESMGRYDAAVNAYKESLKLKPEDATIHRYLAATYIRLSKPKEAIAEYLESLKYEQDNRFANHNLGVLYEQLGDLKNAEKYLRRARQLGSSKK